MSRLILLTIASLLLTRGAALPGQASAEIIGPIQQIPRNYQTWSLFLVCTPDWVTPERSADLANLYRRFRGFGAAIGNDNLAVWFWTAQTTLTDPRLSDKVDVARSAEYCRTLKLAPSAGPYLVVTSAYPDVNAFPQDRAVYELGGLQPADLAKLLNMLTDQLLLEGKIDVARRAAEAAAPAAPAPAAAGGVGTAFWFRLLEGARRSMIGFGCKLRVQVNTGMLSAELRECPGA